MPEFTSHPQGTPSWAELTTTDEQGAVAFYGALFGWVDEPNEMGPGMYYHMQKLNGLEVAALYLQDEDEKAEGVPPHWKTYFTDDDINQSTEKAKETGATVLFGPHRGVRRRTCSHTSGPAGSRIRVVAAQGPHRRPYKR